MEGTSTRSAVLRLGNKAKRQIKTEKFIEELELRSLRGSCWAGAGFLEEGPCGAGIQTSRRGCQLASSAGFSDVWLQGVVQSPSISVDAEPLDTQGPLSCAILQMGLEHPCILVFMRGPGTNPPQVWRDDCTVRVRETANWTQALLEEGPAAVKKHCWDDGKQTGFKQKEASPLFLFLPCNFPLRPPFARA